MNIRRRPGNRYGMPIYFPRYVYVIYIFDRAYTDAGCLCLCTTATFIEIAIVFAAGLELFWLRCITLCCCIFRRIKNKLAIIKAV